MSATPTQLEFQPQRSCECERHCVSATARHSVSSVENKTFHFAHIVKGTSESYTHTHVSVLASASSLAGKRSSALSWFRPAAGFINYAPGEECVYERRRCCTGLQFISNSLAQALAAT